MRNENMKNVCQFNAGVRASGRVDFIVLDSRLRGNDSLRQRGFHYSWMLKRVQHDKVEETGRSMVEMLGVLAIIGVLSAGAIGGYSYAMNKHRTNELIYEATKQAQWAGTQKEMNRSGTPTVAGGSFGGGSISSNLVAGLPDTQIGILLTDLDESVCESLVKSVEQNTNGVVKAVRDETGTGTVNCESHTASLIFNRDLSTGELQAGSNGSGSGSGNEEPEEPTVDPNEEYCSGHGEWTGSACVCQSDYTESDCSAEVENPNTCSGNGTWSNGYCTCDSGWVGNNCSIDSSCSGNGHWEECGGGCICNSGYAGANCSEAENACTTNDNCDAGYFCKYDSIPSCTVAPTTGKCVDAAGYRGGRMSGYVWSNIRLDWFNAKNFCEAQGKHMISISDLNCPYTVDQYKANGNWGYCCATAGSGITSDCNNNYSSAITTLRGTGAPLDYYWTEDLTNDSCYAFLVFLSNGLVGSLYRNYGGGYALCE